MRPLHAGRSLSAVLVAAAVLPAGAAHAADRLPDRVVVGFASERSADAVVQRAGGKITRRLTAVRAGVVHPRGGRSLAAVRRALEASDAVRYVEPDFEVRSSKDPNDPLFATQIDLAQPSDADVDGPETWDKRTSCAKVAVLDTGIDVQHDDLRPNLWVNGGETSGNGRDDDDNGYVDDVYGVDLRDGKGSGDDGEGHGTHVAGIIAAVGGNGLGVAGTCWTGSVMAVKFLGDRGAGSSSGAVEAIEYAVREGAKIINCSFGSSSRSQALEDAVDYAKSKGALLVVAAGNDGDDIDRKPVYPAAYTQGNILTVAASTATDRLASFSNYGDTSVDLAAPGENVTSTWLDDAYRKLDGTSMAAPRVAAAAALLRKEDPDATYGELRAALRDYGDKPPGIAGRVVHDVRLNVDKALARVRR